MWGQGCTRAMPLSPQSLQCQSRKMASISSTGDYWAPRIVTKRPRKELLSPAPALHQMDQGPALKKLHICRRKPSGIQPDLAQKEKLDRELEQKKIGA